MNSLTLLEQSNRGLVEPLFYAQFDNNTLAGVTSTTTWVLFYGTEIKSSHDKYVWFALSNEGLIETILAPMLTFNGAVSALRSLAEEKGLKITLTKANPFTATTEWPIISYDWELTPGPPFINNRLVSRTTATNTTGSNNETFGTKALTLDDLKRAKARLENFYGSWRVDKEGNLSSGTQALNTVEEEKPPELKPKRKIELV